MTLPYKRNFNIGRQSDQFLNEQLHIIFEALRNINYRKNENRGEEPDAIVDGALWFDKVDEALKYWDTRTLKWNPIFNKKFQLIDQMLSLTMPANPQPGQLWIYNGVLMYFDGSQWQPIKAIMQDETQWSNAAFENFSIITPLNALDNVVVNVEGEEYSEWLESAKNWKKDDHTNTNFIIPTDKKWGQEGFEEPEINGPDVPIKVPEELKSQFVLPNLATDRVFIDELHDTNYEEVSKICIQYPTKDIINKTVSAIHLNPNKLSKITKRLVKINKLNSTIEIPPYNTEFYGFRHGEYGGNFLIESDNQDSGDYIPGNDCIILNYNATQNYDYILAITYEFNSYRSDGSIGKWDQDKPTTSFYLSNLQEPINVHVEGLKVEEAAYDVDLENKTITFSEEDDVNDLTVQMWSPYKKQFGYIRETDLEGNGIIKLLRKVSIPLVFVGGTLIHPLYGGLKFENDKIIIPNHSGIDSMKNLAWCVVDLYSGIGQDYMYNERGTTSKVEASYQTGNEDYLDDQGNFVMHGELSDEIDEDGFRDFILASGVISGVNTIGIKYDNKRINKDDGIILFIEGLMIADEEIVRDHANGIITLKDIQLEEGMEYVLLRDHDKRLYTSANMLAALSTGYLDESLVYLNGQLLANENCVTTTDTEDTEALDCVNNEIKYFILNDYTEDPGTWKIFDEFTYTWNKLDEEEINWVKLIVSSYSNQLSSVKINIEYNENDDLKIYSFKLCNSNPGVLKFGECSFVEIDKDDNLQVWKTGVDAWAFGQSVLNIYRNGIKLIPNIDYRELSENNYIKMLTPIDLTDRLTYIIEPIEAGESFGHETILMGPENSIQPNIYKIEDGDNTPDLYPGRLTVYINGIRLPNEDWTLMDNKRIMLKYNNYKTLGSSDNYPEETYYVDDHTFKVKHNWPDYILVEIRKDYDRQEKTIELDSSNNFEISLQDYGLNDNILETSDEVLFFLNGQFANLSRSKYQDYRLDKYKGCIALLNSEFMSAINSDPLKTLFDRNALIYSAWKKQTGKDSYESNIKNRLTIIWR